MRTANLKEWIGANDDSAIPARVKLRVFDRFGGRCAICTRPIAGSLRPAYDHDTALVNGGGNRESNLQLLCLPCHTGKTKTDVAEKSMIDRKRAKHLGLRPARQKIQSRGFPRVKPQRTASRPIERRT